MNNNFHPVDLDHWERREEFQFFSTSGCGFSMTAEMDITRLYAFCKEQGYRLYPLLDAVTVQVMNAHEEYRYAWKDGVFGCYEVLHPLIFDRTPGGNVRCLMAEYHPDIPLQLAEFDRVRAQYAGACAYRPQGALPQNVANISCIPWVQFTNLSFGLRYCAEYCTPMVVFGKFHRLEGKTYIPMSVYCNHAVNDGWHASLLMTEFQERADAL